MPAVLPARPVRLDIHSLPKRQVQEAQSGRHVIDYLVAEIVGGAKGCRSTAANCANLRKLIGVIGEIGGGFIPFELVEALHSGQMPLSRHAQRPAIGSPIVVEARTLWISSKWNPHQTVDPFLGLTGGPY